MKQNETNFSPKIPKYNCESCEYITNNKKDYNKHLLTPKHKNETNETFLKQLCPKKSPNLQCHCGIIFYSRTTLWRHKKTCIEENKESSDKDLIMMLIKENSELKTMVLDVCQKIQPLNNTVNSNNVNSNNKTFNLNVFLNEHCKDAMNIMDFVDSLKLQLSDLESVGKLGFVEGISNIIVKNLKALDVHKRPVHCSDSKREVIYIRDENKWEKENEDKQKLRKVIKRIANKNSRLLSTFKEKHPDCIKSASLYSEQYNKLIIEAMGGSGNEDFDNENKIIKKIAKEVTINKLT